MERLFAATAACLIAACSSGHGPFADHPFAPPAGSKTQVNADRQTLLAGTWNQECVRAPEPNGNATVFSMTSYRFYRTTYVLRSESQFSDNACSQKIGLTRTFEGRYVVGEILRITDGIRALDMQFGLEPTTFGTVRFVGSQMALNIGSSQLEGRDADNLREVFLNRFK